MFNWSFHRPSSFISVTSLNDLYLNTVNDVRKALGKPNKSFRQGVKTNKVFVIDFDGDVMASQSKGLTYEITSVICNADDGDEVLIRLTSPGGAAHAYGYAASQIARLKARGIRTTIAVDKVAASGGYMMACVGDEIISAPFAIIGSIGVVAEFPNFFNFLQSLGIDYKQYTAGEFKRTVSPMGPVTEEGEKKFTQDLRDMYNLFRSHVSSNRPILLDNMDMIATGEHWSGTEALDLKLVDKIQTSEEFILDGLKSSEFLKITYIGDRKTLAQRLGADVAEAFADGLVKTFFNSFMNFVLSDKVVR